MRLNFTKPNLICSLLVCSLVNANFTDYNAKSYHKIGISINTAAYNLSDKDIITGKITDKNGKPISGAIISVKNSNISVTTDEFGLFSIDAPMGAVLQIGGSGWESTEITVSSTNISLTLQETSIRVKDINEIVLVGYASQKKNTITGAVSTVNMEDLSKARVPDVAQALQGQVSGVVVSANTGAPGDGIKMRVRGETTFGASNEPLYVIDGVPTRDISFLNQSDIKSMSVLKDAASSAIYGSRSAGGVVIITTKSGLKGRNSIDIDYYSGFSSATNLPKYSMQNNILQ